MRITRYTDYAMRVLIYLTARPEERVTIGDIATAYGISKNHLMKVAQRLGALGIVRTVPGRGGGLQLGRDAGQIRIGEVVKLLEADLHVVECFDEANNTCPIAGVCGLEVALGRALDAFLGVLNEYTLNDLVRSRDRLLAKLHPVP